MIRQWCEAMGDSLAVYRGPGDVVAPPTMLQAWTMHDRRRPPTGPASAEAELMALLARDGYVGVVATNCEQEYMRPLRPGDRIRSQATITAIAGPKKTGLGEGYFVTTETQYHDDADQLVGTMLFRVLRYRSAGGGGASVRPDRPELPSDPTAVFARSAGPELIADRRLADVCVGDALEPLELLVTPTLIICGAIASCDFNVLHHDRDRAVAAGAPDIFMNILTTNGLVGRFVTEWAGPAATVERVAIRLGAPNYPYDTFRLEGSVAAVDETGAVDIAIRGTNSVGDHVTGTVGVRLS
jgi:acyl dehydratase